MRRARFKVAGENFDGTAVATVVIEGGSVNPIIRVRPLRRRKEYTVPLAKVALTIIWSVVRAEAAEKAKTKKRSRKRLVKRY
jgi:hypothetical protein